MDSYNKYVFWKSKKQTQQPELIKVHCLFVREGVMQDPEIGKQHRIFIRWIHFILYSWSNVVGKKKHPKKNSQFWAKRGAFCGLKCRTMFNDSYCIKHSFFETLKRRWPPPNKTKSKLCFWDLSLKVLFWDLFLSTVQGVLPYFIFRYE